DKNAIIARQKRCVRYFSAKHETSNCTTNYVCKHCQATHHTALCDTMVTRFAQQTANGNTVPTNVMASFSSANTYGDLVVKTATVMVVVAVENIGTIVFKQRKPNAVEQINAGELAFRGTWKGAPLFKITTLETDYIGYTGPYFHTAITRKLWLEDQKMADDRCLDSENYFTNLYGNMENMEARKEAKECSPPQPRSTEKISSQEFNHTSRNKKKNRKIMKEELKRQTYFDLSLFWILEHFAILEDCDAVEPKNLLSSFGDKITRQEDGRYCTPIPWKTDKW
ncbi:Uncharacterized protein APZ42_024759, partial [Daphnia magna]